MKSCEVFDEDNELLKYLANKKGTSKKWVVNHLLWFYATNNPESGLKIENNKIVIKNFYNNVKKELKKCDWCGSEMYTYLGLIIDGKTTYYCNPEHIISQLHQIFAIIERHIEKNKEEV